jgi:NTE family protein
MYAKISTAQVQRADIVIRPRIGHIGSGEFDKRHEAILEGERAALAVMPQIKEAIAKMQAEGRL